MEEGANLIFSLRPFLPSCIIIVPLTASKHKFRPTTTMYVWPKWTKHHSHQDHSLFHIHYEFFYLPSLYYVCVFGGPLLESCTGGKRQIQARFHSHKRSLSYNIHQTLQELLIMCKWFQWFQWFQGDWCTATTCRPATGLAMSPVSRSPSQCRWWWSWWPWQW